MNPRAVLKGSGLAASAVLCDALTPALSTRLHTVVTCSLKTEKGRKWAGGFKPGVKEYFVGLWPIKNNLKA